MMYKRILLVIVSSLIIIGEVIFIRYIIYKKSIVLTKNYVKLHQYLINRPCFTFLITSLANLKNKKRKIPFHTGP